jgi:hypothetical protein
VLVDRYVLFEDDLFEKIAEMGSEGRRRRSPWWMNDDDMLAP